MAEVLIRVAGEPVSIDVGPSAREAARQAQIALDAATLLGGAATLGQRPVATGFGPATVGWQDSAAGAAQPSLFVDVADTAKWHQQNGQATPTGKMTAVVDTGEIELECIAALIIGMLAITEIQALNGFVYSGRDRVTAGGGANAGVIIALTPAEPTLGGAVARTDAGACLICIRQNGTVTVTQRDAFTAFPGAVLGGGGIDTFADGDEVEWALEYSGADATEAVLKLVVAGRVQDDHPITGLPADCWLGSGIRSHDAGTTGRVSEIAAFAGSLDVVRRVFLVEGAADGGDGSLAAPFNSPVQLRRAILRDFARASWWVGVLGTHEDCELAWDGSLAREVAVIGVAGRTCVLDASVPLEVEWTQIAESEDGEVWHATHPGYPGNSTYGGVIWQDAAASQTFGRTGSVTIDGRFSFGRMAANTAATDEDFVRGLSSVHNTGGLAGEVLIRMPDGSDPNDAEGLRWSKRGSALSVKASDEEGLNLCRVAVLNLELSNPFLAAGWFDRVHLESCGVVVNGGQGFGLEVNHCSGGARRCTVNGTMNDSFHASGDGTAPETPAPFTWTDCVGNGSGYFPSIVLVADIFSNHDGPENPWVIVRCAGHGPGKSVIASPGGIVVDGLLATDAWDAAVQIYAQEGIGAQTALIQRLRAETSLYGVSAVGGAGVTGIDMELTVEDSVFDSNAVASLFAYRDSAPVGTIAIVARNYRTTGSTPSDGHKKTSGGATITVESQAAGT